MKTTALISCEEFERLAADIDEPCELIDGEIVILSPGGNPHSAISMNIGVVLMNFVKANKLGRVLGNEAGIHIREKLPRTRGMDVAFISYKRLPAGALPKGFLRASPELVVEVLGDKLRRDRIAEKIADYHSIGVDCVWVADPDVKTMSVHPRNGPVVTIPESGEMDGGEFLPGFCAKVSEFFDVS